MATTGQLLHLSGDPAARGSKLSSSLLVEVQWVHLAGLVGFLSESPCVIVCVKVKVQVKVQGITVCVALSRRGKYLRECK